MYRAPEPPDTAADVGARIAHAVINPNNTKLMALFRGAGYKGPHLGYRLGIETQIRPIGSDWYGNTYTNSQADADAIPSTAWLRKPDGSYIETDAKRYGDPGALAFREAALSRMQRDLARYPFDGYYLDNICDGWNTAWSAAGKKT
jgi:hypothetical protein